MADFDKRIIVVTGAASGLGAATAKLLASRGASVIGIDRTEVDQSAGLARSFIADVTDDERLIAIAAEVRSDLGTVSGLATFAGIEVMGGLEAVELASWRRIFDINVIGSANAVRAFLPDLEASGRGAVVLCSSQLSLSGGRECVAYSASKGAINSMCRSLAIDLAARGIRVNAVAPGATETPMMERAFASAPPEVRDMARLRHAMGRFGQPHETAAAASFLLAEEASFITGVVLPVDGGWTAA